MIIDCSVNDCSVAILSRTYQFITSIVDDAVQHSLSYTMLAMTGHRQSIGASQEDTTHSLDLQTEFICLRSAS